jgi:hypothetical protein
MASRVFEVVCPSRGGRTGAPGHVALIINDTDLQDAIHV